MAYTPKTWTTGETITAAELNAIEQAASAASSAADTANSGLSGKVNSGTYTAGLAGKADLASGTVPDAQLPTRLSDASLKAAFDAGNKQRHSALRPARAALAARSLNVLHIGDSVTDGYAATALGKRWVDLLPKVLRSRLGLPSGGLGFLTPSSGWSGSGWPVVNNGGSVQSGYGLCGRTILLGATTQSLTLNLPVGHTGVDIYVVGYSGGGTVNYTVDGGTAATASTSRGWTAGGVVAAQIRGLSASSAHTVVLRPDYNTPIFIEGFMCYAGDETAGVRSIPAGLAGATSAGWLYANNANQLDSVSTLLPQLVTIELGVNDYTSGDSAGQTIAPAQLKANLQTLMAQVRSHYTGPGPSFVLMGMWQRANAGGALLPHTWDEYMQTYQDVADADAARLVTFLDMRERVNPSTDPALGTQFGVVSSDQIHPTDVGHAVVADALADFLLAR